MTFLVRRLIVLVSTLVTVSFVVFLIPYLTPGDPARKILRARVNDPNLDAESVARLRTQYGLDRPLLVQYADWLLHAVTGDLGISYTARSPIPPMIVGAIQVTVLLTAAALIFALAIALPLGSIAAMKRGRPTDTVITTVTQGFVAIPEYWMAPLLVLAFAVHLRVLPSAGWTGVASMVLPCLTLAMRPISYFTQVTRASMADVLDSPHIIGSRARGLSYRQTIWRHGIRNALIPVVTLFSVWLGGLLGGSVVVEVIFGIPGMGRLVYDAVLNSDIPVLQAAIMCIVTLTVAISTVTDVVYTVINPTVRSANVSS
ncbi:ABC transporter permease [Actinopolymorpha alba]|uniref:ABC transporter permease n=1 Tax=Actinopolymorpha alba TaxID=533267 RepID=UPI00036236DC|nr:ABC transporter permease [Actinopolymorpha alba]